MILINFTVLEKEKHNLQIWRKNFFFFVVWRKNVILRFWRENVICAFGGNHDFTNLAGKHFFGFDEKT